VALLGAALLTIDLAFWGANLPKIPTGGWFPLVIAGLMFTLMTTWKRGRQILGERLSKKILSHEDFIERIREEAPPRMPGTAVFMDSNPQGTPHALLHNLEHNKMLHERVVFLTVVTREIPYVPEEERAGVESLGENIYRITAEFGFAEDPDVPSLLAHCETDGMGFDLSETTFFLGRETMLATKEPGMAIWREKLFVRMSRNAQRAAAYFHIPSDRVVEIGTQIEL